MTLEEVDNLLRYGNENDSPIAFPDMADCGAYWGFLEVLRATSEIEWGWKGPVRGTIKGVIGVTKRPHAHSRRTPH